MESVGWITTFTVRNPPRTDTKSVQTRIQTAVFVQVKKIRKTDANGAAAFLVGKVVSTALAFFSKKHINQRIKLLKCYRVIRQFHLAISFFLLKLDTTPTIPRAWNVRQVHITL